MIKILKCKCGRCGKRYNIKGYSGGPNAIAFGLDDGDNFNIVYNAYDLCPECLEELITFLDNKKSDACSNTKILDINTCPETLDDFKKLLNSIDIGLIINYRKIDDGILFIFYSRNTRNIGIYFKTIPSWHCYSLTESELVEILFEFIKEKD